MEYAIAVLERVRARLAALPKPDERNKKLNKQDSIGFLAKDLIASLRSGHTVEEIVAVLATEGVEMSPVALKSYLHRSRPSRRKRGKREGGSSEGGSTAAAGGKSQGVHETSGRHAPEEATGGLLERDRSAAVASSRNAAGPKGSFVPGKDTDKL